MTTAIARAETEPLIKLMIEEGTNGWRLSTNIEDVPPEVGHYSLRDGLRQLGCGVTYNMRRSIQEAARNRALKRPIYEWKPDDDGSAALWLDGKIRCNRCPDKPIFDIWEIDRHGVDIHGDEPVCECS